MIKEFMRRVRLPFSSFRLHPSSFRLAGMTRLELANQLIEGQPAFHFAFIPKVNFEFGISDCEFFAGRPIGPRFQRRRVISKSEIRNSQSEI